MSKQKHVDEIYNSALFLSENIENIKDGTYKSYGGNYEFKLGVFGKHLVSLNSTSSLILINVPLFKKTSVEMRMFSILWCYCKMETDIHIHYQSKTISYMEADLGAFKIMFDKHLFKDKESVNIFFTDYCKIIGNNSTPNDLRIKTFYNNVKKIINKSKKSYKFSDVVKWIINTVITLLIAFFIYMISIIILTKNL